MSSSSMERADAINTNTAVSGTRPLGADGTLGVAVQELAKRVAEDATHPKAEVLMPSEQQLQVRLVKLDDVLRVQEAGSDEAMAAGAFWALLGALLGIGVNLVTGEAVAISKASWVAIAGFSFFSDMCRIILVKIQS